MKRIRCCAPVELGRPALSDRDRPLAPRGRQAAAPIAKHLHETDLQVSSSCAPRLAAPRRSSASGPRSARSRRLRGRPVRRGRRRAPRRLRLIPRSLERRDDRANQGSTIWPSRLQEGRKLGASRPVPSRR
jgi:hypothetical protein